MKNNSRERKAQRRERARVGLIRTIEMNTELIADDRTTQHTREIAQIKLDRSKKELARLGEKEIRGTSEFKNWFDEVPT